MAKNRILYGVILLICVVFYLFYQAYLSHLTLLIALFLPVCSLLAAIPCCLFTQVQVRCEKLFAEKGEEVPVSILIKNSAVFPCPRVQLAMRCINHLGRTGETAVFPEHPFRISAAVSARSSVEIHQAIASRWCGKIELKADRVWVCDLLGLFRLPLWKKENRSGLFDVLPAIQPAEVYLEPENAVFGLSDRYSSQKPGDDPSEVFQIREFREGDNLRRVHWKLSQRMDTLMIRDFSLPIDHALYFLIEPGAGCVGQELDEMLEVFAALSSALLLQDCPHWAGWMEKGVLHWEMLEAEEDLSAVLDRMLDSPVLLGRPALSASMEGGPHRGAHFLYCTTSGEEDKALSGLESLKGDLGCRQITLLHTGGKFDEARDFCQVLSPEDLELEELVL